MEVQHFQGKKLTDLFWLFVKRGPLRTTDCQTQIEVQHFQGKQLYQKSFVFLLKGVYLEAHSVILQ